MQFFNYVPPWICHLLACMGYIWKLTLRAMKSLKSKCKALLTVRSRGCFGCFSFTKSTLITAVDEPSQGLTIQGRTVKKPDISQDFWTSGTEMYNIAVHSRSISSTSATNQPLDSLSCAGSTSNPSEFVNHGLLLWIQMRQQWLANKPPKTSKNRTQSQEPAISWSVSYESLLGTNKRFTQPVPLSEMVDFLVDVWEQEGLYD